MWCILVCAATILLGASPCIARGAARPTLFDEMIARQARAHGVTESFIHRTVMRESGYNPRLVHHRCYGLMQIKYATARGMGYRGDPRGLLDPEINLTYGVPYLANAYRLAGGDESRATALFRRGYYYVAKRKGMLGMLRTASSPQLAAEPAQSEAPEPPESPLRGLLLLLAGPSETAPSGAMQHSP